MGKVYYVNIQGHTLESRNLRELLARAVSEKRNKDRKFGLQRIARTQAYVENQSAVCAGSCS
jgi:hypothetical protein